MGAKEYLQQGFRLNSRIAAIVREIEYLREVALFVSKINGMAGAASEKVQSRGEGDKIGEAVARIADLEAAAMLQVKFLLELQEKIKKQIAKVANEDLRLILYWRYVSFEKWEQIAVSMNYSYRYLLRRHNAALQAFWQKNKKVIEGHYQHVK